MATIIMVIITTTIMKRATMTAKRADQTAGAKVGGFDYMRDPDAIYRASFAAIARALDLTAFAPEERPLVSRLVHACGLPEMAQDLVIGPGAAVAGRTALAGGAAVLVDAEMVARGIIQARLPVHNEIICTLNAPGVADRARGLGWTRSATAVDMWPDFLDGSVVSIGNAPTALFRLLELLAEGAPKPALIIGFPVGFIGAAEAKAALADYAKTEGAAPVVTLRGRFGGSALAAAAVNALGRDGAGALGRDGAGAPGRDGAGGA